VFNFLWLASLGSWSPETAPNETTIWWTREYRIKKLANSEFFYSHNESLSSSYFSIRQAQEGQTSSFSIVDKLAISLLEYVGPK
jgi:hypothetical protein